MPLKFGCLIPNLAFFEFTQCLQSTRICVNLLVLLQKGNEFFYKIRLPFGSHSTVVRSFEHFFKDFLNEAYFHEREQLAP